MAALLRIIARHPVLAFMVIGLGAGFLPAAIRPIADAEVLPFDFTSRPGTDELWIGDVGWNDWEEINVLPRGGAVQNFGWPCYEGNGRQSGYDGTNLNICEGLYSAPGAVTAPYFAYHHSNRVVPNEACPTGSSSTAGLEFEFVAAQNSYRYRHRS